MFALGVNAMLDPVPWFATCWTNCGIDADGSVVTGLDGADSGPLPFGFAAVTVKVYDVLLARPVTTAVVGAGNPLTVVDGCGVLPMYGVIVYAVEAPPVEGAVHVT